MNVAETREGAQHAGQEESFAFSIVIPTIGTDAKLERLLSVLQATNDLGSVKEIIVVWQGDSAAHFLRSLPSKVRILLCETRAVSYARNRGAEAAKENHIIFLDDDTIPAKNYPEIATHYLKEGHDFLHANVITSGVKRSRVCQSVTKNISITRKSAIGNAWEPGFVIGRDRFLSLKFDENIGPGCLHGSSEGLDLAIRLLEIGLKGVRAVDLVLDHPIIPFDSNFAIKVAFYGFGNGYVSIRHRLLQHYAYDLTKALARIAINIAICKPYEVRISAIRFFSLMLGPLLKPQPPLALSPKPVQELPQHEA